MTTTKVGGLVERLRLIEDAIKPFPAFSGMDDSLREAAAALSAHGQPVVDESVCNWRQEDEHGDCFGVACGPAYIINDCDTDGMKFCTFCGERIAFHYWQPDDEDETP